MQGNTMKKQIKTLLALILTSSLVLEFSACAKNKDERETTQSTTAYEESTSATNYVTTTETLPVVSDESTTALQTTTFTESTTETTFVNDSIVVPNDLPEEMMGKIKAIYGNATIGPQTVTSVNQLAILTSICATFPNGASVVNRTSPIFGTPLRITSK